MKKNVPRFFAWLLLLCGLAGGPVAARLWRPVSPGILRWLVTAGAALMIISFFWFPRRGEGGVKARRPTSRRKRASKVKQPLPALPDPEETIGRRARKQSQAAAAKRSKR